MYFHDICGNEHAKRAAEVALAGDHSIVFVGPPDSVARDFYRLVHTLHVKMTTGLCETLASTWQLCPCGYLTDDLRTCTCSEHTISQWYYNNPFPQTDIYVEVTRPTPEKMLRWAHHYTDGEPHVSVMQRILSCRAGGLEGPFLFMDAAWSLLTRAADQLALQPSHLRSVVGVAKTIARLAKAEQVKVTHMAEAIQYRPRHPGRWTT